MPPGETWDTFPFDGELMPRALLPPVAQEELRRGGADEAPEVYKRLPEVLSAHGDSIRVTRTLRPVGVARGRESGLCRSCRQVAGFSRSPGFAPTDARAAPRPPTPLRGRQRATAE